MSKRKNKDPGGVRQVHQTRSFEQLVADATLQRLGGYIDNEIQGLGQALLQRQQQAFGNILTRLVAIEGILCDKLGMSKDELAERVATVQDQAEGFDTTSDAAQEGDRIRLEIKTRTEDQTEYQGSSRFLIDNVGAGNTLGKELESAILGLKAGETKELLFGKDNSMHACITVNRISRKPAPAAEEASQAPAEETQNADVDAG